MAEYTIERASTDAHGDALVKLYHEVFAPEHVDELVKVMYPHLPGMPHRNWITAVPAGSNEPAAATALIPWQCRMAGIPLNVAEQGIVGTHPDHRKRGLMRMLNNAFDEQLAVEVYDLAIIQGIPGFYHNFGYRYAIPLENHINLVPDACGSVPAGYTFRNAGIDDIPLLMQLDQAYQQEYFISTVRDRAQWEYLLTRSTETEYGAEFIIMTCPGGAQYSCRIPFSGFGSGMHVSEVSADITGDAVHALFAYLATKLQERGKPFIRINLPGDSAAGRAAVALGAEPSKSYAWQVKIPNPVRLLKKMKPVFDRRLQAGAFKEFTGTFRLNRYTSSIDLLIEDGAVNNVVPGTDDECRYTLCVPDDCLAALVLGHRTWHELQYLRPEVRPQGMYIDTSLKPSENETGKLADVLFPAERSWLYERY